MEKFQIKLILKRNLFSQAQQIYTWSKNPYKSKKNIKDNNNTLIVLAWNFFEDIKKIIDVKNHKYKGFGKLI